MGDTIDIYVKYAGPLAALAHRVARTLDVPGYFLAGTHATIPVEAARWIDAEGWGLLSLDPTDLGEYGDPGFSAGTAFAPYERYLSLEYRGPRERLGRALFDRLTALRVPLLLAESSSSGVIADFLPGRAVRNFPPGTSGERAGRDLWFEPALHGVDVSRSFDPPWSVRPPWPPRGQALVFETEGLLQGVAVVDGRWATPKVAVRIDLGAAEIGRALAWVLGAADNPGREDAVPVSDRLAGMLGLSVGDFARGSVSVEVLAAPDGLRLIPHAPHPDGPLAIDLAGPVADELIHRGGPPDRPEDLGALVLGRLGRLRERAGPRPLDADRVVAALRRHILRDDEQIEARHIWPDAVAVHTDAATYWAQRADWLVTRKPWMPGAVRDALRVIADAGIEDVPLETYGVILERDGGLTGADRTLFLNDVTDLWTVLGRWLGRLDPLAFAELVAEFHSGPDITGPVVVAPAVSELVTAGSLIRDVDAFVADHPSVDPALVCGPMVRERDGAVEVEFCSYHRYLSGWTSAVDVLRWRVARAPGKAVATWTREYVARGIEQP